MLGEGGETKLGTNVNFLLEEFGIALNSGIYMQWNLSNLGQKKVSICSLFQWSNCMQETVFGERKSVLIREVSSFQGLNCMQETVLGERKSVLIREVSSFQGCPY